MARQPGLHHELVLIDQSQLRQRQREGHASREQSLTRLPLQLLNGLPQTVPAHELRVPIDVVQGARHDVLLCRVDRAGEGFRPLSHPIRPRAGRPPPRCFHHFVGYPAKEEGIGLRDVLGRVTMQVFVRDPHTMIAASVQCDVDGIPKGSHCVSVSPISPTKAMIATASSSISKSAASSPSFRRGQIARRRASATSRSIASATSWNVSSTSSSTFAPSQPATKRLPETSSQASTSSAPWLGSNDDRP